MKKIGILFFLGFTFLSLMLVSCNNETSTDKTDNNYENPFVLKAKKSLQHKLDTTIKKGTKAESQKVLFVSEKDSICVIGFNCIVTKASGRTIEGECEYIYCPLQRYQQYNTEGVILFLDTEQSIIERAKDFADEVEEMKTPEQRDSVSTWEDCMKYVVPLTIIPKLFDN